MNYPKHVALIPDWNRTWAKSKWLSSFQWHLRGFNRAKEITEYIFTKTPIQAFTIWWLSTENFQNRSKKELDYLFELYKKIPWNLYNTLKKNNINFRLAWNIEQLPEHLTIFLREKEKELSFDNKKYLTLAINYGWQDEILRWIEKLVKNKEEVSKENLEKYLDFWKIPNVELVIRTKQQLAKRLSWFMLWRISYAQLYFTDLHCPDFTVDEFKKALKWFNSSIKTQNHGK